MDRPHPASVRVQLTVTIVLITGMIVLAVFTGLGHYIVSHLPIFAEDDLECGPLYYDNTTNRVRAMGGIDLSSTDECATTGLLPFDRIGPSSTETGCLVSNSTHFLIVPCDGSGIVQLSDTETVIGVLPVIRGGTGNGSLGTGFVKSPGPGQPLMTTPTIILSTDVTGVLSAVYGGVGTDALALGYVTSPGPGQTLTTSPTIPLTDTTGTLTVARGGTTGTTFTAGFLKSPGGTGAFITSSTVSLTTEVTGVLPLLNGGLGHSTFSTGYLTANGSDIISVFPVPSEHLATVLVDKTFAGEIVFTDVGFDSLLYADGSGIVSGVRYEFGSGFNVTSSGTEPVVIHIDVANFTIEGGEVTTIVPISFGGTGQSSLSNGIMQVNSGTVSSTTAPVGYGGTGITTYAVGDFLYASGTATLVKLAAVAVGNVLHSGGVTTAPTWAPVSLTVDVSGTLPVANGGLGIASYTVGSILYASGTTTIAQLADVATGSVLISGGVATAPVYGKVSLTGHIDTATVLPVINGGTNIPSYTVGAVLYASATTVVNQLLDVATGNVLLSGGLVTAPAYGKVGLTTHVVGVLPVANGGTDISSYTVGAVLYASASNVVNQLLDVATGNVLLSGGLVTAPAYGKVGLTTHVSGVLPVVNGGTNINSYTVGSILFASATTTIAQLADVATGSVLISGGVSTAPAYGKVSLTGHIDTATVLPVINGGTNIPSYTVGAILYASATTVVNQLADVATGNVLISGGVTTAPSYGKVGLTTHVSGTLPVANGGTGATTFTAGFVKSPGGTGVLTTSATVVLTSDVSGILPLVNGGTGHSSFTTGYLTANSSDIISIFPIPSAHMAAVLTDKTFAGEIVFLDVGFDSLLYADGSGVVSGVRYEFGAGFNVTTSGTEPVVIHIEVANFTSEGGEVTSIVPVSFGGTGQSSLSNGIMQVTSSVVSSATAPVGYGGTGITTYAVGDLLYASGAGTLSKLAAVATGNLLHSGGVGTAPSWSAVSLTADVTGVLAATTGGTGQSVYVVGDILYASTTTALSKLADIATGNVLISGGVGTAPSYGKVVLTTHVSGTLGVSNGGTGLASYTVGSILYASGTTTIAQLDDIATGNVLLSGGVTTAPSYGKVGLTSHVTGILPVANGGTNIAVYTVGSILYASTTGVISQLADVATGNVLRSGGVGVAPAYGQVDLVSDVVNLLGANNGGTGIFAYTAGDMLYYSGSGTALSKLASSLTTKVLHAGAGGAPSWGFVTLTTDVAGILPVANGGTSFATYAVGDMLYASATGTLAKLVAVVTGNVLLSGGVTTAPVYGKVGLSTHTSGTLDLTTQVNGVLAATNGGTDQSVYAVGDILYASATTTLSKLAASTSGFVLHTNGAASVPTWGLVVLTSQVSGILPVANGGTGVATFTAGIVRSSGGTTALTTTTTINVATEVTGVLDETNGGTGQSAYATGDLLYASATNTLARRAAVATGSVLISQGVVTAPIWGQVTLTTHVVGILPVANGGTGVATFTAGIVRSSGGTTALTTSTTINVATEVTGVLDETNGGTGQSAYVTGDLLYASATNTLARLADVATGNVLISGGVTTAPAWGKVALTTHVSGVLPVANGGTNIASYTVGAILYASASGVVNQLADVATGNVIISGGVTTAPSYGKVGLTTHVSGTLAVANGGTGQTTYTNGQLLIGTTSGGTLTKATLTAGTGISITNGAGSITIYSSDAQIWLIRETYTGGSGQPGASVAATRNVRNLNTMFLSSNSNVGLLGSGMFSMIAGTYDIEASAPAFESSAHQLILYGVTVLGDYDYGTIAYADSASDMSVSWLRTRITIASGEQNFQLLHYTSGADANGLGTPVIGWPYSRNFAEIKIVKVA